MMTPCPLVAREGDGICVDSLLDLLRADTRWLSGLAYNAQEHVVGVRPCSTQRQC